MALQLRPIGRSRAVGGPNRRALTAPSRLQWQPPDQYDKREREQVSGSRRCCACLPGARFPNRRMGSSVMAEVQWYYARDDEQLGPLPPSELRRLAASGGLAPTDLVWREGM